MEYLAVVRLPAALKKSAPEKPEAGASEKAPGGHFLRSH